MSNENFMGMGGFLWFSGVVEDRQDPLVSGRVRVRILGQHTENKSILPTADLPWALVMLPVTSSGVSGIGCSATGLLEGSWVFGFFRDGHYKQEPVILGSLPGKPIALANPSKGFNDPNGVYPKEINEPDVNRLAVGDESKPHPSRAIDTAARLTNISCIANSWDQPPVAGLSTYPYNNVYETESGHIVEFDNTINNERIRIRHRSGTTIELRDNGDYIELIRNNAYSITNSNSNVYIQGYSNCTVDGNINIQGNSNISVQAAGNLSLAAGGTIDIRAGGAVTVNGSTIDLN